MSAATIVSPAVVAALVFTLPSVRVAPAARRVQQPEARMAPLEQYLIADRRVEVALARSAAPAAIAAHAGVIVLGRRGYEVAVEGSNGFVCMVERSWMAPFDNPDFWNPRIRGPICYNPAAARSIVPLVVRRTALVLSGLPKAAVLDSLRADARHAAAPGAMAFMLSRQGHLDDVAGPWLPHLMFYVTAADSVGWGADVAGSPVIGQNPQFAAERQPIVMLMVPVETWSDGSPARSARDSRSGLAPSRPRRQEAD